MKFSLTPDSIFNNQQARQNANIRARLQTVGQETITGRRSDVLQATSGRLGDAFLLEKASTDISRQQDMARLAGARLSGASASISSIRETIIDFAPSSTVTLAQGGAANLTLMAETAGDHLSQIMSSLGRRSGSRHLFGGTQTSTSPLAASDTLQTAINAQITSAADPATAIAAIDDYFNLPANGFETDIYVGSDTAGPRLHVGDNQTIDPLPKADDPIFRDILQGLSLMAGSGNAATRQDQIELLDAGLSLLNKSVDGLLALESRLGASEQSVERVQASLQTESSLISAAQDRILGRDVFDAAAELQALEGQLQASYTVTGRLGSLSLVNFLR